MAGEGLGVLCSNKLTRNTVRYNSKDINNRSHCMKDIKKEPISLQEIFRVEQYFLCREIQEKCFCFDKLEALPFITT